MTRLSVAPGYESLANVLDAALEQAQGGKGRERHSSGEAYEDQPIVVLNEFLGSNHGALFQACKKARESARLAPEHARAELLGAINYLAAAVIILDRSKR
jgi:hypothetical protein